MSLDSAPTMVYEQASQDLADAETLVMPGFTGELETSAQPSGPTEPQKPTDQGKPEESVESEAPEQRAPKLSPKLLDLALKNFADHHGVDVARVTEKEIAASKEGVYYWATCNMDVSARGAGAQAMNRAFKQNADLKASYAILTDSLKQQFRRAWMCEKSFDFVHTARSTVNKFIKRRDEAGTFKTQLQIVMILGGADQPTAVAQAQCYVDMCLQPSLKAQPVVVHFWRYPLLIHVGSLGVGCQEFLLIKHWEPEFPIQF